MHYRISSYVWLVALLATAAGAQAQQATFVYRLGRDTVAVEQLTRAADRVSGEVVTRTGAAVTRQQYEVTLGRDGRPTAAVFRSRNAAGAPLPNQPTEIRLTFSGDSVKREAVFADSTSVRTVAAARAIPFISPAYGLYEAAFAQLRRGLEPSLQFATMGLGANPGQITLFVEKGDTVRASTGVLFVVDRDGRLLAVDAGRTTQKLMATRDPGRVDLAALARSWQPTGALSGRGNAHASFQRSVVFINYGRPMVRGRTVWGGLLIPPDTIWRLGANEATHLATSRELTFGNVVVPPGLYSLFLYNAREGGPQLVINQQIGQWGTEYNPAQDVGRVPLTLAPTREHVEEFTITIRNAGAPNRGAIDFAWGDKVATAQFTVR